MTDFLTPDVLRDPYPLYAHFRAASPLLKVPPNGPYLVLDHAGVRRLLDDHENFSNSASPSGATEAPLPWLIFFDPPRHTKLRALVSRAFTPRSVAELEPRIGEISRELIDAIISRGGQFDLVTDYAEPLPLLVIGQMLGLPASDRPLLRRWSNAILGLAHTISGDAATASDATVGYIQARDEMEEYLIDVLRHFRSRPADNLLNRLALAEVDGERLSHAEILGFFQLLLLAGSETTINLISIAVLCLLEHPAELARLRNDMTLLPRAIEETLRFRSPVQAVFRATRRAVELHGQTIPPSRLVLAMVGSANRDPTVFKDPDRFDITRADAGGHVAFGHGIHFCLGAPLARLEARVALHDLLTRLPNLRRANADPWPPRPAFHVHGPASLPMVVSG